MGNRTLYFVNSSDGARQRDAVDLVNAMQVMSSPHDCATLLLEFDTSSPHDSLEAFSSSSVTHCINFLRTSSIVIGRNQDSILNPILGPETDCFVLTRLGQLPLA